MLILIVRNKKVVIHMLIGRPIPLEKFGNQITVFYTRWYLDWKVKEWIALGGVHD
jgi:hypothetical protein